MDLVETAVARRPFPQLRFMSEFGFASFLDRRGINIGFTGLRALVESKVIQRLGAVSGDYHAFQVWPISCLLHRLEFRLDRAIGYHGLDPDKLKEVIELNWPFRSNHLKDFPQSDFCVEFNQRLFPLLLWIESLFIPDVRGPRPGVVRLANSDVNEWNRWSAEIDPNELLTRHGLTADQLSANRSNLLFAALNRDPASEIYLLLRSMSFEKRERLEGSLRLAHDLYEMAEIIRLFLERLSYHPISKEWDPAGPADTMWTERLYGSQPKFGSPEFLRPLIRRHGLDPAFRVRWLVEGETEEGFILSYAGSLGWNVGEFVTIRNFGGEDAFKKQIAAIDADLKAAKAEQCFVTLTFDDSDDARDRLANLQSEQLVNLRYALNKPDFETTELHG